MLVSRDPPDLVGMHVDESVQAGPRVRGRWRAGQGRLEECFLERWLPERRTPERRTPERRIPGFRIPGIRTPEREIRPRDRGVTEQREGLVRSIGLAADPRVPATLQRVGEQDVVAPRHANARAHQRLVGAAGRWPDPADSSLLLVLGHGRY